MPRTMSPAAMTGSTSPKSAHRSILGLLFFLLAALQIGAAPPGSEPGLGPLGGRNMYAPHLPWFSFPADTAAAFDKGSCRIRTALYYINEFSSYPLQPTPYSLDSEGRLPNADQETLTALDYESTIMEFGVDWQFSRRWRGSVDWRLHFRYGGFLDKYIESWHNLFGFANAGREYFSQNQSLWKVRGNGITGFTGSGTVAASGDLDLRAIYTILENPKIKLAAGIGFKIPTGEVRQGFGSGYPDLGLGFIAEWRPWKRWIFFGTIATVIPLGPEGRMMGQFIPGIEFRAFRNLSIIIQGNLQSAPFKGYSTDAYNHRILGYTESFSLMQTDIKIGLKGSSGAFGWQLFFEEDPLTWEGPDIQVYFGADWSFQTHTRDSGK